MGLSGLAVAAAVVVVAVIFAAGSDAGPGAGSGGATENVVDSSDRESAVGRSRWTAVEVGLNAPFLPTLANAEFAVGANRLSFTVTDARNLSVADLDIQVRLFDLSNLDSDPDPPAQSTQFARFIDYGAVSPVPSAHTHSPDSNLSGSSLSDEARYVGAGVYVVPAFFPREGIWGLEFTFRDGSSADASGGDGFEEGEVVLFRLQVRDRPSAPSVGDTAIAVETRTVTDEPRLERLTSDLIPEPGLYALSIDEALASARPLVLIFSTPAFCHSRTCGPSLEVVKAVWRDFASDIDAIHVEVFENPDEADDLREAPAFNAWRLPSEPWIFVIDGDGIIFSRYEGTITAAELRGDVMAVLQR